MKSIIVLAITMLFAIPSFADLWVSPGFVSFGTVKVGTNYNQRSITVRNNSKETVNVQLGGYCEPNFRVSGFCGTLNQNGSCNINVVFKPTRAGSHNCSISVRDSKGSFQTVSIQGYAN